MDTEKKIKNFVKKVADDIKNLPEDEKFAFLGNLGDQLDEIYVSLWLKSHHDKKGTDVTT